MEVKKAVSFTGEAEIHLAFVAACSGPTTLAIFASAFVRMDWPMSSGIVSYIVLGTRGVKPSNF